MNLICVGDAMVDVVVKYLGDIQFNSDTPSSISIRSGGAAANTAVWAAKLGINTTFVGHVGEDSAGKTFASELRSHAVKFGNLEIKGSSTGTVVVLVDESGERTMFPSRGANSYLSIADFPSSDFDALYLSGYSLFDKDSSSSALEILDRAKQSEKLIFLDPASTGLIKSYGRDNIVSNIADIDFLLLYEEGARFLSQQKSLEEIFDFLLEYSKYVVIKLGRDGSSAKHRNGSIISVNALPVKVLDTTGAGDAFAAGFMAGWLSSGDIENSLKSASKVAAECISNIGARPSVIA